MSVLRQSDSSARLHYAWIIAAVTALVLLGAAGVRTAPQVLIMPLENEFKWMRADISFAVAISILWYGLGGVMGGTLVERFGVRQVMVAGLAFVAVGLLAILRLSALWQLHLFYGLAVGIGTGMLANVLGAVVAQRWFIKQRGMIVGLFGAASATGQLIFLPSIIALNGMFGWRGAIAAVAAVVGAFLVPVILLMRERPEDIHARPFGEDAAGMLRESAEASQRTSLAEAVRSRDFWFLAVSFFFCGYTTNGLIGTHLLPNAIEHGISDQAAGGAIAMMGGLNILGTVASGWLTDRYDNRWLLAALYGCRAIALLMLPFVGDLTGLLVFAVLYGVDWMATVPPTINLVALRFGRASVGVLYGWIFFAHMVGAASAAYLGGALRDLLGNYTIAFISAAALVLVGATFVLNIRQMPRAHAASNAVS